MHTLLSMRLANVIVRPIGQQEHFTVYVYEQCLNHEDSVHILILYIVFCLPFSHTGLSNLPYLSN